MSNQNRNRSSYDALLPWQKEKVTPEEWDQICKEVEDYHNRDPDDRYAPEPSMTLPEVDQAGLADLAAHMRSNRMEKITRSEFFLLRFPQGVPMPWLPEMEAELPKGLQHEFRYVSRKLPRAIHPDFDDGSSLYSGW
jgi:hypothetical protein